MKRTGGRPGDPGVPRGTDADLWPTASSEDPEAFGVIFDRHVDAVHRFCVRRTGSADAADDLVPIVFGEAWRFRANVMMRQDSALPWLIAVARHTLADRTGSELRHPTASSGIPPTVRPMSDRSRARARAALLAEIHSPPVEIDATEPDVATFDRSGLDDAPRVVTKRGIVVGVALAAALAGAAVVAWSGALPEERARDPVASTPSPGYTVHSSTPFDCMKYGRMQRAWENFGRPHQGQTTGPFDIEYEHQGSGFAAVAVSDGQRAGMCLAYGNGSIEIEASDSGTADPITQVVSVRSPERGNPGYVVGGQVADDVTGVRVDGVEGRSTWVHVSDGFYSALLDAEGGETLSYVITRSDGSTTTVTEDDLTQE